MTEKDIIVGLNNIAAKYGYGKGTEPFTNDEWNTIFCAKEIIKDYAKLTAENDNLTVELEVTQRDVENLTRTLEEATDEIKALEAENVELRATLSKMETVEKELRARLDKAIDKELVAKELAHIFDCPCNFSPLEEEMWAYCRDNCVDDNVECWIRVINKKCEELKGGKK